MHRRQQIAAILRRPPDAVEGLLQAEPFFHPVGGPPGSSVPFSGGCLELCNGRLELLNFRLKQSAACCQLLDLCLQRLILLLEARHALAGGRLDHDGRLRT